MSWYDRDYARDDATRQPLVRWPRWSMVTMLVGINVLVYALTAYGGESGANLWHLGAMRTNLVLHGQIWRLLTAQYLHASFGHLLFNMLGLYFLGSMLEQIWGRQKFFAVYTLCGLMGNLFYLLLGSTKWASPYGELVGASGCILGVLGAEAVLFPTQIIYINFLFPIRIRTLALICTGLYMFNILRQGSNYGGDAAHLAGLAFGAWWAWTGDRWWRRLGIGSVRAGRPARGFHQRVQQRADDARLIDEILAKVHEHGVQSLSYAERRMLQEATERQRQDEQHAGRTDRL